MIKQLITMLVTTALMPVHVAEAQTKRQAYVQRIKQAPVTNSWEIPLRIYTGGYYGVELVNILSKGGPRGKIRQPVLGAAAHYHIPFKVLIGIWGAESSYGKAWDNFGLTDQANGNLRHDALIAASILRSLYKHDAVR